MQTKLPQLNCLGIRLVSLNGSNSFSELKMNKYTFDTIIFEGIDLQMVPNEIDGSPIENYCF